MKKFLALTMFAALGACTTTSGQVADIITQIQAITTQVCKFVPTAETVAGIIAAEDPTVATAGAVASAICKALTANSAVRRGGGSAVMVINGQRIVINGRFV